MSRRVEAPTETEILFWAQAPVTSPVCKECKGAKYMISEKIKR